MTTEKRTLEAPGDNSDRSAAAPDAAAGLVFCSSNHAHSRWLAAALDEWPILQQALMPLPLLTSRLAELEPRLVLLDFSGNCADSVAHCATNMIELAQMLKKKAPDRLLVAVGTIAYPEGAVAALRAGINHFIDISAPADEAREIVRKLISAAPGAAAAAIAHGTVTALLGARAGVGATTLAVHLSDILRQRKTAGQPACRVALLDLGFPTGDGQLYLNAAGNFHFADAVRNLHRLDQTLIQTALTRSRNGIAIIPLPRAMPEMAGLADADALTLLKQLRLYFDVVLMDLGGHPDAAFAARLADAADRIWLLTDQSAGALVSLAALLARLGKQDGNVRNRQLIVNRHDRRYGMSAPQIAERFGLPLAAVIPDRTPELMGSANQGKLLHEVAGNDPYVRAVGALADKLANVPSEKRGAGLWSRWKRGFFLGH